MGIGPEDSIRLNGQVVNWDAENTEEISMSPDGIELYESQAYAVIEIAGQTIAFRSLPFEDGTIQIQPKSDMMGRTATAGGHANFGYSGYFKGYVYLDGKRKRLVDFWSLFPNGEHHYEAQKDKFATEAAIRAVIGQRAGTSVSKVKGGYAFDAKLTHETGRQRLASQMLLPQVNLADLTQSHSCLPSRANRTSGTASSG
ncbi:hypothetical protein ML401_34880 (plasmid) [Bradyrhizobium sp. 62B]|uniref:hypothetical protein n=1 Tax=Bradyrhizobium sp. 62B TaxID=2898442 RepID=UPI00255820E0|nr:hypothetical protein ML401_34880 [Bradyrhizobium sp. 62B]